MPYPYDLVWNDVFWYLSGSYDKVGGVAMCNEPEQRTTSFFRRMRQIYAIQVQAEERINKHLATGFNVVQQFIQPNEEKLSAIFAWLLDPRESHGQGATFFNLFFSAKREIDVSSILSVKTEVATSHIDRSQRRIDIVLEGKDWIVGMENKPWAAEQYNQLTDYQRQLLAHKKTHTYLYYLPGNVGRPTSDCKDLGQKCSIISLPYRQDGAEGSIEAWLEQSIQFCQAEKVRFFLGALLEYIRQRFRNFEMTDEGITSGGEV